MLIGFKLYFIVFLCYFNANNLVGESCGGGEIGRRAGLRSPFFLE